MQYNYVEMTTEFLLTETQRKKKIINDRRVRIFVVIGNELNSFTQRDFPPLFFVKSFHIFLGNKSDKINLRQLLSSSCSGLRAGLRSKRAIAQWPPKKICNCHFFFFF